MAMLMTEIHCSQMSFKGQEGEWGVGSGVWGMEWDHYLKNLQKQ